MKQFKKIFLLLLVAAFAITLVACNDEEESAFVVGGRFESDGEITGGFGAAELQDLIDNPAGSASTRTGGASAKVTTALTAPTTVVGAVETGTSLSVGSTTELSGSFLAGWSNNASDNALRGLIF